MPLKTAPDRPLPALLDRVMNALCTVAKDVSDQLALGALENDLGKSVGSNSDGDTQKALDVIADDAFRLAMKGTGVRWYASEERDDVELVDADGTLAIAIDPLDGSSNIGVNGVVGTIFAIHSALDDALGSFLRTGDALIAAGYFIYGPQDMLMLTHGDGVRAFILDRRVGSFREVAAPPPIPDRSSEFAINASNYRHWSKPIRAFIDDCIAGSEGPRGKNFNMRWLASLVGDAHRILNRGGFFLYPGDDRPGYEAGRLRMVYECVPLAWLIEQAGGGATDGMNRILEKTPESLHARTPFVFGAASKVAAVTTYHDLSDDEVSALFGNRGLFRA